MKAFTLIFAFLQRVLITFSCVTEEHTVELNLGADKDSLHLGTKTLVAKSDSTSSRSAIVENQVTQLEFLSSSNTKVQNDAFTFDLNGGCFHILERST